MMLCNYLMLQALLLILHILRVLIVAHGARKFAVSSEETEQAKAWSPCENQEPEAPSPPLSALEAVTPRRVSTLKGLAAFKLSGYSENRSRRHAPWPFSAIRDDAQSVAASHDFGFVQQAHSLDRSDDKCCTLTRSKDEKTFRTGAAAARSPPPTKSPSKSPSITRASRIPVMSSRSRSPRESRRSSSISATRETPTTIESVQSPVRVFSPRFSHSSLGPGNSRLDRAGVSDSHTSSEQAGVLHSATRRSSNTYPPAARPNRQEVEPSQGMNEVNSSSAEENAPQSPTAAERRWRLKSLTAGESDSKHQKESVPLVAEEEAGAGFRETVVQKGKSHNTMPSWTGCTHVKAVIQSSDVPHDQRRPITRLRRGGAPPVSGEIQFLLNQSVEKSFEELFSIVAPDLAGIAQSLSMTTSSVSSQEDGLTAHIVYNMFSRKKYLNVGRLEKRRQSAREYVEVCAVPERLLGVGGASIVYQMKLTGLPKEEQGDSWAVKVHYAWAPDSIMKKSFTALRSLTEETVVAVNHFLSRVYSPSVLFSRFHFLVPYFSGEVSGLDPVLLPHHSDRQKFLLNLITIMPLMPGSFDRVLSTEKLSPAAKRVICLSFVELVARLHLQMLVHADLKPANFFLGLDGRVYLGDLDTVGWQNSLRRCGAMATVDFLDPLEAQCHIQTPDKLIPLTTARDAWALGLSLFLVWCGGFPFDVLNKRGTLSWYDFVSRLRALTPNRTGGDSTTPELDFQSCPEGMIADGLVLELIQRFLELDRNKRWSPVTGYKFILSAGVSMKETVESVFS